MFFSTKIIAAEKNTIQLYIFVFLGQGKQNPLYEPFNLDDSEIEDALNEDDEEGDLLRQRDRFFDENEGFINWSDDTDEDPTYDPPNGPDPKEDTSEEDAQPEATIQKDVRDLSKFQYYFFYRIYLKFEV